MLEEELFFANLNREERFKKIQRKIRFEELLALYLVLFIRYLYLFTFPESVVVL